MGNCGFGIVPSPPPLRDMIMRNLAVVEGMDLDALRAGIDWQFQSFAEYMRMLRGAGPYMNLGVLVGHSAVRTAVMGEEASVRKEPTAAELAEMKRLVAEALDQGAIGLGASYSLNHSGWGGVPMPSTISDISEFDALVGAMGGPGRGVVEISSGPIMPDRMEEIAARHGRRIFMSTAVALYNEQYPERALRVFDACAAAQTRGNELYIQITCQPLSFDFTLASAYPLCSHPAFDPIKAYDREQLRRCFATSFTSLRRSVTERARVRGNRRHRRCARNGECWARRTIADVARSRARPARRAARSRLRRPPMPGTIGTLIMRSMRGRALLKHKGRRSPALSMPERISSPLRCRVRAYFRHCARTRRLRSAGRGAATDQPSAGLCGIPMRPHRSALVPICCCST
jgi:N-acyl-D-aspartate/D-glutamate deacylase